MAITSENKLIQYRSTHFKYALTYVIITLGVLLFLNIYSSKISQQLFYNSKETSMIEKCQLAASNIAALDVMNESTVSDAINALGSLKVTRLIVTDQSATVIYDSLSQGDLVGEKIEIREITNALESNDVFGWDYHDGKMESRAAAPIYSYGTMIGCVYIMEYDAEQGELIRSLQYNTLTISIVLETILVLFSLFFSRAFTARLRRIMVSMRIIREGDYSHRVKMGGNDELTVLGDEFNDLTKRLKASEDKRRQFVSDASHELKTPLASIKLLSDSILQNEMDTDTIREFASDIGQEAERLNKLSQKLLSLSRIESQDTIDCEIVKMAPTIEKVCRMLRAISEENQVHISLDLADDAPILILEDDLYQIVFNLVENGIKYNVSGGTLTVSLRREQENVLLSVADTGVGIPEEALEHIFERFYRVDKARSRQTGGSGLGLSIVQTIVDRNGGEIHAESVVGKGTTFTVSFPVFDIEE